MTCKPIKKISRCLIIASQLKRQDVNMYYIEVNKRISQIVIVLHQSGIWCNDEESISLAKRARKLFYLIFLMSYDASIISCSLLSDNWNESVYLIAVGIAGIVTTIKMYYFVWKQKEIRAFISQTGTQYVEDYEEFVKVKDKVKSFMNFSSTYLLMVFVGCGLLVTFSLPVFSSEIRLPFNIWFPLDWKNNSISYWIAFAFVFCGMIGSLMAVMASVIIWYLMLNCSIKYQILGNQFRNMFLKKTPNNNQKGKEENLFVQEIIGLIKVHQNIQE